MNKHDSEGQDYTILKGKILVLSAKGLSFEASWILFRFSWVFSSFIACDSDMPDPLQC
jgi:hypothetical protein